MNRKWIGCDISEYSIYLTRKRILNYHKKLGELKKNKYSFEIITNLNKEKRNLIDSGFFEKDMNIKRIK